MQEVRFFPESNFSITNDKILDYFDTRGGVRQFGFPISREFVLFGDRVQIFQRQVIQIRNGAPTLLNLQGPELMPFTAINGAVFPGVDPGLAAAAPTVGSPDYDVRVVEFVRNNAPDTFDGMPVNFGSTFFNSVSLQEAFPRGGDPNLLPLIDLELWGVPLSRPAFDPNNFDFVYQRFQRGVMHFNKATRTTQGLLLAQYFKAIITGENLPEDLAQEARNSPFFLQYNNDMPLGLNRPELLPNTNMKGAFEPETPPLPAGVPTFTPTATRTPTLTPTPGSPTPTPFVAGPNCNFDANMIFVPELPQPNSVVTITVTSPTAYSSVSLLGPGSPHFIGVGTSDGKFAWKWRVLVTESGLFNYDFFVNATQLCATGFFVSGGPTPTPGPTATPTNTPTPTATPTPLPVYIVSISPPEGAARGQTITIVGTNFGTSRSAADGNIVIGGAIGTPLTWADTIILAVIPSSALTGTQVVQVIAHGAVSNLYTYSILPSP